MVRTYRDYLPMLKEEYPDIPEEVLERILLKGMKNIQHLVKADLDVRIGNHTNYRKYMLTITRPLSSWDELMKRAKDKYYQLKRRRQNERS